MGERHKKIKRKNNKPKIIVLIIIMILLLAGTFIYFEFSVKDIEYIGNKHYNEEQMNALLFHNKKPNALLFQLFGADDKQIPFIQKCDYEISWPNKITVNVYEKAIVGYIKYMGCNMYFDKDGIVVESSSEDYEDVPEITGLKFKQIVLNSKLDVGNDQIYNTILEMTQAFDKYKLSVDKVYFDNSYNVTLYMGNIKVLLGDGDNCTDKLFELYQVKDKLEGFSGTLHLDQYDADSSSIIFQKDKED